MTVAWAVHFPRLELRQIGRLWNVPDVEVCQQSNEVWLRGHHADDAIQDVLRGFLSGQRFQVRDGGQLQSPKSLLPKGHLPTGPWHPLREWMTVSLPTAALSGQVDSQVPWTLVRTESMVDPTVLMTQIGSWLEYGSNAPLVRLNSLRFAMTWLGEVLIQGQPLPSIAGQRFVVTDQIAVPAGWTWSPAVDAAVLAAVWGLKPGDLAVLLGNDSWFPVCCDRFVRATRQALRASAERVIT